jgi:hypothetical protein
LKNNWNFNKIQPYFKKYAVSLWGNKNLQCLGGKNFNIGYERSEYLNTIATYIGNKLIKMLVGQRRFGKSFVLRQIISYLSTVKGV